MRSVCSLADESEQRGAISDNVHKESHGSVYPLSQLPPVFLTL